MSTNIQIKIRDIELTDALQEYVDKRPESINKFFREGQDVVVHVELGKTTNHHKQGDIYSAQIDLVKDGHRFHIISKKDNLYAAIDDAQDELLEEMTYEKDKRKTLWVRGARSVKKMMKGLSKRNPFTSKY